MEADIFLVPNENDVKRMKRQLNEDEEKLEHLTLLFQKWLEYQTHLPQNFRNVTLKYFLRACKMDLMKTKRKFEMFCYLPLTQEKLYGNRKLTLEGDLKVLDYIHILPLPQVTSEGYRITVVKTINSENVELLSVLRYALIMADYRLHNEVFIAGEILIVDCKFKPYMYPKLFTPMLLHFFKAGIEACPSQFKQIFVISSHSLLEKVTSLFNSVLHEKIRNRIFLLNSSLDLSKHISERYLPSDYNGVQNSLETLNKGWKELMLKNVELFKNISERKPSGAIPKYIARYDESLGIDGSFRKLNID